MKDKKITNYENNYTELLTELVKKMRKDLYGNSKKINKDINNIYFLSGVLKK